MEEKIVQSARLSGENEDIVNGKLRTLRKTRECRRKVVSLLEKEAGKWREKSGEAKLLEMFVMIVGQTALEKCEFVKILGGICRKNARDIGEFLEDKVCKNIRTYTEDPEDAELNLKILNNIANIYKKLGFVHERDLLQNKVDGLNRQINGVEDDQRWDQKKLEKKERSKKYLDNIKRLPELTKRRVWEETTKELNLINEKIATSKKNGRPQGDAWIAYIGYQEKRRSLVRKEKLYGSNGVSSYLARNIEFATEEIASAKESIREEEYDAQLTELYKDLKEPTKQLERVNKILSEHYPEEEVESESSS